MFRQIKSFVLVAITFGVVMGCSAPVLADRIEPILIVPEKYGNDTGDTAYCLEKILWGMGGINSASSNIFANYTPVGAGFFTIIQYFGAADGTHDGYVNDGDSAWVRYKLINSARAPTLCAIWYSDKTCDPLTYLGYATPGGSISAMTRRGSIIVEVAHMAYEWDRENEQPGIAMGTIYGSEVYYATTDTWRTMDELNDDLIDDPPGDISWIALDDFELNEAGTPDAPGSIKSYNLGELDYGTVVLFRYSAGDVAPGRGTPTVEMAQFRVPPDKVPAVSEWGVVVMGMLLLTAGTIVYMRRRAVAAQA